MKVFSFIILNEKNICIITFKKNLNDTSVVLAVFIEQNKTSPYAAQ